MYTSTASPAVDESFQVTSPPHPPCRAPTNDMFFKRRHCCAFGCCRERSVNCTPQFSRECSDSAGLFISVFCCVHGKHVFFTAASPVSRTIEERSAFSSRHPQRYHTCIIFMLSRSVLVCSMYRKCSMLDPVILLFRAIFEAPRLTQTEINAIRLRLFLAYAANNAYARAHE